MISALPARMRQWRDRLRPWVMAIRPRTLTIGISPVILGTTIAWREHGSVDVMIFAVALLAAALIQAGTNLHNDAADAGADAIARLGPPRVTALGLLSAESVRRAAYLAFALAMMAGLWLVLRGGWPILMIGLLSLAAGLAYSGGPRPLSHTPLGELFVVLFFGLAGTMGSYWLQAHALSPRVAVAGLVVGLPAAAVLLVNNTRDVLQDAAAGRRTLAMLLGRRRAAWLYAALLLVPYGLLLLPWPGFASFSGRLPWPALITLPYAVWLVLQFHRRPLEDFNLLLVNTAKLQFALSALLALALVQ
jgi:1,4-dihydroxy-2-naphthoate octaprenyltransferase